MRSGFGQMKHEMQAPVGLGAAGATGKVAEGHDKNPLPQSNQERLGEDRVSLGCRVCDESEVGCIVLGSMLWEPRM